MLEYGKKNMINDQNMGGEKYRKF